MSLEITQQQICKRFGAPFLAVAPFETAGVARNVGSGLLPLNGLRHPKEAGTSGWFIWAGEELSRSPDFFAPVHVTHLQQICPALAPYLGLGPGWRFLIAPDYEDVWFDPSLLQI